MKGSTSGGRKNYEKEFERLAVFASCHNLIDVLIYSFEEGYNFASQTHKGIGWYNYSYVLHDTYFLQALKNTFILVIITVPLSTGTALLIAMALNSIKKLRELFQTVFFLPYVTNTLAYCSKRLHILTV